MALPTLLLLLVFSNIAFTVDPLRIPWSRTTYGPDGPWHAVSLRIGTPKRTVDLLPSSDLHTFIPSQHFCSNQASSAPPPNCAKDRTIWNSSQSKSVVPTPMPHNGSWITRFQLPQSLNWHGRVVLDSIFFGDKEHEVPTTDILSVDSAHYSYPFAPQTLLKTPFNVGTFSLGTVKRNGLVLNQQGHNVSFNLPFSFLYGKRVIPSTSYGLHLGSVRADISPSLYLGGYDQTRALGSLLQQQVNNHVHAPNGDVISASLRIILSDIKIGVAGGSVPFKPVPLRYSILSSAVPVQIQPATPYLFLPARVCVQLARALPIKFNQTIGFYLWDTSDSRYRKIIQSDSYLNFTFLNDHGRQIHIKAPWQLFDLELDQPIAHQSTKYFPCVHGRSEFYVLGRAFLQAAFIGVLWQEEKPSHFVMAQAPGPNTSTTALVKHVPEGNPIFQGYNSVTWQSTWDGYWKTENSKKLFPGLEHAQSSSVNQSSSNRLGLAIGLTLVISFTLALLATAIYIHLRRRHRKKKTTKNRKLPGTIHAAELEDKLSSQNPYNPYGGRHEAGDTGIRELDSVAWLGSPQNPAEIEAKEKIVEAPNLNEVVFELHSHPLFTPAELRGWF